jgi:hypothetical protein
VPGKDTVILVAEIGSVPYRAVARLAELAPGLPPFALIGGLAVITDSVKRTGPRTTSMP